MPEFVINLIIIAILAVVLGGIIYLLFRPETYVAKLLPQTPFLMHLRQALSGEGWDFLKFYFRNTKLVQNSSVS